MLGAKNSKIDMQFVGSSQEIETLLCGLARPVGEPHQLPVLLPPTMAVNIPWAAAAAAIIKPCRRCRLHRSSCHCCLPPDGYVLLDTPSKLQVSITEAAD